MSEKVNPFNLNEEMTLWNEGYTFIAGVDECGRGPFAGNVVAGAVIMPQHFRIPGLTDSKKIPKKQHEAFAELVKEHAISWAIGEASVEEIDTLNIKQATQLAMKRALEGLEVLPRFVLVDGLETIATTLPQKSIIKGDYNSHTIAAASLIAKVYRDKQMEELDKEFNDVYDWKNNAGYQTKKHVEACKEHGLTPYHRKSWKTYQSILNGEL